MRQLSDIVLNQDPLKMPATTTVADACLQMRNRRAGSVLVTGQDGALIGIFTGRDAVGRVLAAGKSALTTIGDVMTPGPKTMGPDKTAIEALRLMWDGGFRHIPVLNEGKIVGVVSRGDFSGMEKDRLEEERALWEHMR